jgi:hypothetical protein
MPKFRVYITRDTSETGTIVVEAENAEYAKHKAWQQYHSEGFPYGDFYEPDDYGASPFISDCGEEHPDTEVGVNTEPL